MTLGLNKMRTSLSYQLIATILLLVILPTLIISAISYRLASDALYNEAYDKLKSLSALKVDFLNQYNARIGLDLQVQSESSANEQLLKTLLKTHKQSTLLLSDFTKSEQWSGLFEELASDLITIQSAYNYYDILILSATGEILFSLAEEDDLGTNLFTGKYSQTLFASAARKAYRTGKQTFSDLEPYAPSGNNLTGFYVRPLLDEYGDKFGLIVFQINMEQLEKILLGESHTDHQVDSYILSNSNLKLLSTSLLNDANQVTHNTAASSDVSPVVSSDISSVVSPVVKQWITSGKKTNSKTKGQVYNGLSGDQVLGVFTPFKINDKSYTIITEVALDTVYASRDRLGYIMAVLVLLTLVIVTAIILPITHRIVRPIIALAHSASAVADGDLKHSVDIKNSNELGVLANGFNTMLRSLRTNKHQAEQDEWLQQGVSRFNDVIRGEQEIALLSTHIMDQICSYLEVPIGAFYLVEKEQIKLSGSYAFKVDKSSDSTFRIGEGMVGQAVYKKKPMLHMKVPDNYFVIRSGLGATNSKFLSIIPVLWNQKVIAVIELGSLNRFDALHEKLIQSLSVPIAVAVNSSISRDNTHELLERTQAQAEELQAREEELSESNHILEKQSDKLEKSAIELEEKNFTLQTQQEELKASNEELEVKAHELSDSSAILEEKNSDLDMARIELINKAKDLEESSRYKSEFLANMSHELRTPLNSVLILAKLLADNKNKNLDLKQIEYASTIHDSGTDLLNLINDILDLSKIEAGHMDVHLETVQLDNFLKDLERRFSPVAEKKGITFEVENSFEHESIQSDGHKLSQIVKNLLSNAIKFTRKGGLKVKISSVDKAIKANIDADQLIQISVTDSGIGIPEEKQKSIFEAFQQADGTTSRQFGGTGLGLSISRELAKLLGGEMHLHSAPGKGSTFSVLVSRNLVVNDAKNAKHSQNISQNKSITAVKNKQATDTSKAASKPAKAVVNTEEVSDDRKEIRAGDRTLLIIEDDANFSSILADVAREKGFKVLIAADGETGLYLTDFYKPSGIILDIGLPSIDGWEVMRRLKNNLDTRHIPVHFMSGKDKTLDAFRSGALGYLTKPINMEEIEQTFNKIEHFINKPVKKLLLIEDNKIQQQSIIELISADDVHIDTAATGNDAIKKMTAVDYDCIVLDLGLPDMNGASLLETIRNNSDVQETPVVIYSGQDLDREEKELLEKYANSVIIKNARSPEILLDETALFMHRVEADMPESGQQMLRMLHDTESVLTGRHILVVDDDMRNIFALTTMLRDSNMEVTSAKNGIEALEKLDKMESVDLILMDIMMPEMDGYETMENIRKQKKYDDLPILALTAKAMKGDRAKCIESGANDYLSKPIDTNKLLSMMRVWLYR